MAKKNNSRRITLLSMLIALAMIFSILENFLPQPVPGVKLGLANLVGLIALIKLGIKDMWIITISRVLLTSLLLGTFLSYGFYFAISGAIASLTVASALFKSKQLSMYSISAGMAIAHVVGQIIVVCILYNTWGMLFYLPITLTFAFPAGLVMSLLAREVSERLVI